MIIRTDDGLQVAGDVTMATVSALFKEGLMYHKESKSKADLLIDFARLEKVDSSAVSLMLGWLREAKKNKVKVKFINIPDNLMSLARLYGVAEMFHLQPSE